MKKLLALVLCLALVAALFVGVILGFFAVQMALSMAGR